ncbi:MAG: hypothetical protein WKF47_12415 [Geodermatophilaceae bacterium]
MSRRRAVGGATLVDVTDPANPRILAEGFGDFDTDGVPDETGVAHQVHSALSWQAGLKAYAVLVDDEEVADVDIFDITNPARPVKIAEYDLAAMFPQILQPELPTLTEVFFHDVIVKRIDEIPGQISQLLPGRQVMLASYWDAGYVALDVSDPTSPVYLGDTDFTNPDPELLESTGDARGAGGQRPPGGVHQGRRVRHRRRRGLRPACAWRARNLTDDTALSCRSGQRHPQLGARGDHPGRDRLRRPGLRCRSGSTDWRRYSDRSCRTRGSARSPRRWPTWRRPAATPRC